MARKNRGAVSTEFPLLDELNLYASATTGDGNCLFRALSDQVFGDENHHGEIRHNVVSHVEQNADHFSAFVGEYGETFEQYIARLYQDGVYGGHIELVGFSEYYKRPIAIYQAENMYVLEPQSLDQSQWGGIVHVAYHTWEHYSSVRQKSGPRSGPVSFPIPETLPSFGEDNRNDGQSSGVAPWQIEIVLRSVPHASETEITEMLRTKDLDMVIEELLMREYGGDGGDGDTGETPADLGLETGAKTSDPPDKAASLPEISLNTPSEGPPREVPDALADGNTDSTSARSHNGKATSVKANKKQQAKKMRQEKKERVRQRRAGNASEARKDRDTSETAGTLASNTETANKVIHI